MAKITVADAVHVDIRIDGVTIELDLAAGDADVEQAVADLLIAQGLATVAGSVKGGKKNSAADAVADTVTPDVESVVAD